MNLQHERIAALCQALKLERVADHYGTLAQQAVRADQSFSDYPEQLLQHEQTFRQQRSRALLTRMACFPAIKTLKEYDFGFSPGVPKALLHELAALGFVERAENIVLIGPSGIGKTSPVNFGEIYVKASQHLERMKEAGDDLSIL